MHLTKQASVYLENVWLWTADQYDLLPPGSHVLGFPGRS